MTILFLMVLFVAPFEAEALASQITAVAVASDCVLTIVRFCEAVPLFEPSMVT